MLEKIGRIGRIEKSFGAKKTILFEKKWISTYWNQLTQKIKRRARSKDRKPLIGQKTKSKQPNSNVWRLYSNWTQY